MIFSLVIGAPNAVGFSASFTKSLNSASVGIAVKLFKHLFTLDLHSSLSLAPDLISTVLNGSGPVIGALVFISTGINVLGSVTGIDGLVGVKEPDGGGGATGGREVTGEDVEVDDVVVDVVDVLVTGTDVGLVEVVELIEVVELVELDELVEVVELVELVTGVPPFDKPVLVITYLSSPTTLI